MSHWQKILQKAENESSIDTIQNWFINIAQQLLNHSLLLVNNTPHRLIEIEFYYFAPNHQDFFTHRDTLQTEPGKWYFHRHGGTYKGGTFKGLDLTFGNCNAHGGILIRSIETSNGDIICGPSLCVDYLLSQTNTNSVAALDGKIAQRPAGDKSNIIQLETAPIERTKPIFSTARVGLSLKKATTSNHMHLFILRPYRYLTEPRKISKGKVYLVLALHSQGMDIEQICQTTGSPQRSVREYINNFELGRQEKDFSQYYGMVFDRKQLCRLHGTWYETSESLDVGWVKERNPTLSKVFGFTYCST